MFQFRLDGSSGVPPYLQIVHQVRQSLLLGYLREGDRLPTVKDVASDLVINPNTVVKAYRQLEHEGLAGGRPGQGTFITATASPGGPEGQQALRAPRHEEREGLMVQDNAGGGAPALRADRLGRRYGQVWGLRDCTLELPAGAVAALVGPNGAGKTTLLEMIIGLLEPTEGQVSVFGVTSHAHVAA